MGGPVSSKSIAICSCYCEMRQHWSKKLSLNPRGFSVTKPAKMLFLRSTHWTTYFSRRSYDLSIARSMNLLFARLASLCCIFELRILRHDLGILDTNCELLSTFCVDGSLPHLVLFPTVYVKASEACSRRYCSVDSAVQGTWLVWPLIYNLPSIIVQVDGDHRCSARILLAWIGSVAVRVKNAVACPVRNAEELNGGYFRLYCSGR